MSGPQLLKDWIKRRGFSQAEAAQYLGLVQEEISTFVNGRRRPVLEKAVHIERLTGIPAHAWVSSSLNAETSQDANDTVNR